MEMKLQNRVLTKDEIQKVIAYHRYFRRKKRNATWRNFMVFRLSCCCGLRRKEIAGLNLGDFFVDSDMPFIRIRKETTKGYRCRKTGELIRKARKVSLRVDQQTREDLIRWLEIRKIQAGGNLSAPFVCGQRKCNFGKRLLLGQVAKFWQTTLLCLGRDRARSLSIHTGRHSCISMLVHLGYPLAFVRDFAGHRNIATTSLYAHAYDEATLPSNAFAA